MSRTVCAFTHESKNDAALFGEILRARGFALNVIDAVNDDNDGFDALAPDLLLFMGGPMHVADGAPHVLKEINIIKQRLNSNLPILGVCLGAQLMAAALGAKVYAGEAGPEFGWKPLKINKAGQAHPVSALEGMMFHAHRDTFDLPAEVTLLGSSDQYRHQIFSHGEKALAIQSHPEVRSGDLQGWYPAPAWMKSLKEENGGADWDQEEFLAQTAAHIAGLNARAALFLNAWLDSIGL